MINFESFIPKFLIDQIGKYQVFFLTLGSSPHKTNDNCLMRT